MHRRSVLTATALGLSSMLLPSVAQAATLPPALFVAAHPDDEILAMGVTLAEHIAAGQDVHVLWMTDGEGTGIIDHLNGVGVNTWWGIAHDLAAEDYAILTEADVAVARVLESSTAVECLSAGLSGALTMHRAQLPDGSVTMSDAQAAILSVCDSIAGSTGAVRLKGHTWATSLETHPDHLAVGNALKALTIADSVRFSDRRHYLLPDHWTGTPPAGVTLVNDLPGSGIAPRVLNACRSYGAWSPKVGSYAIGMHSVPALFNQLTATTKCVFHA